MRAQEGLLAPPSKYSLIQIYNFDDLPLIAMNVARIGAQIPSMVSEVLGNSCERPSKKIAKRSSVNALIGFGPMMWILITPDAPVRGGFRAFHEIEINEKEVPETDGDVFLYFSADDMALNQILAESVEKKFGGKGERIEEFSVEGGVCSNFEKEKILINNSYNLDTIMSSFVFTQKFNGKVKLASALPQHNFSYISSSGPGFCSLTFSNHPAELQKNGENISHPPISRGLFFLPSLDLLTSLRMGGIRMGSLAINAKWKE